MRLVQIPASGDLVPALGWSQSPDFLSLEVELVEVRFKNKRIAYYRNAGALELSKDERIVVESGDGYDLGTVTLTGSAAREKYQQNANDESQLEKVIRRASMTDLEKWLDAKKGEYAFLTEARNFANQQEIDLSIRDVEFRGDGQKASIYYSTEGKLNSGRLARQIADTFMVKVDMCRVA